MKHVMIDLETLATTPDAAIISIGAINFDPYTGNFGSQFYEVISFDDLGGRHISPSTVNWWLQQGDEARQSLTRPKQVAIPLEEALQRLKEFLPEDPIVWGNGSIFDISILENAYQGIPPWDFWAVRDMRTIVELGRHVGTYPDIDFVGTAHNALSDAIHQAKVVTAIIGAIPMGTLNV